jgi:uncharacterized DUF497 family protein
MAQARGGTPAWWDVTWTNSMASKLSTHNLDLVAVQEVTWDKMAVSRQTITHFTMETEKIIVF